MNEFVNRSTSERSKINSDYLNNTAALMERLGKELNIFEYRRWSGKELGIGFTPLVELPEDVNPFAKDNIHIFYKSEYLNRGGSGKGRPVSFMLHYYDRIGRLGIVKKITTAGFGNFIRTLAELLPFVNLNIVPVAYMGNVLIEENSNLVVYLKSKGVVINGCEDNHCPTGDMERGKAIANAHIDEQVDSTGSTLFLDQHGVFKPLDGLLNAAGYCYSLAPEILYQLDGKIDGILSDTNLYYVNGEGTRGSLVGTVVGLKKIRPRTRIVGLRQQEDGHIFGLRSLSQLGKSESLDQAEKLCDHVYEITDKEAYTTKKKLWDVEIPATTSGGSYVEGALKKAAELKKENKEGIIVTLIFDSLDYYRNILSIWDPKILGERFDVETFETLRVKAYKERENHVRRLKNGGNDLFNSFYSFRSNS